MATFRAVVFALMIPLNLLLIAWMGFGRMLILGHPGWMFLFVGVAGTPIVFICLLLTTILAFNQKRPRPRLTVTQTWLQIALWAAMLAFGLTVGDADDVQSYPSLYGALWGEGTPAPLEGAILMLAFLMGITTWIWLLTTLIQGARPPRRAPVVLNYPQ